MYFLCSNLSLNRSNTKSSLKSFAHFPTYYMYKTLLIERFYEHLPRFLFKLDFVKFCNSEIRDFENFDNILKLDNMPG